MIDVSMNGVSMASLGWIRESIDFPTPKLITETVIVPGRNAPIRFTEALGSISYEPRAFSIVLTMLGYRLTFNQMANILVNQFTGRLVKVVLSEEDNFYYYGTVELNTSYDPLTGKGQVLIECSDGDSYKYHVEETIVMVTGDKDINLENDYKPVVPTVTTTDETVLSWKVGTDSFSKTVSKGTWAFPEMQLNHGNNWIHVKSNGNVTFQYREGCL